MEKDEVKLLEREKEWGREAVFAEAQDSVVFSHISFILCDCSAG